MSCLFLQFSDSLTREARGGGRRCYVSGWRTGRQPVRLTSSILRFFDANPWARDSVTIEPC